MPAFGAVAVRASMTDDEDDSDHIRRFLSHFPSVERPLTLCSYATPERYDELYMGEDLRKSIASISNDRGGIAWGFSSRMGSLNDMYRVTGDLKYLEAGLRCVEAVLRVRDDRIGAMLWTGRSVSAWGCDIYASRGRAVFAVHTGVITAPIIEFLILSQEAGAIEEGRASAVLRGAIEAIAVHDRQWRVGPLPAEGHYVGMDQEEECENRPLPGNRLSAIGLALWFSWKLTGNEEHRERALALGTYVKRRLLKATDGAYYSPYWLPCNPVEDTTTREEFQREDTSHAGLTMALPLALAIDDRVFTKDDLTGFAATVLNGFARLGGGILLGDITGSGRSDPHCVGDATRWLALGRINPEIHERIIQFYLRYKPIPGPRELSRILLYARGLGG